MQRNRSTKKQQNSSNQLLQMENANNIQNTQSKQIFNVEMTVSQANAIGKLLPECYSIHVDRTLKSKRAIKRKHLLEPKNYKSKHEALEEPEVNKIVEEEVINNIQTISYDQMVRKCQKILNLLKKNKNSWPFKEPVDSIALGIPHYSDIIKNPMDLKTVGQNLSSHKYATISQFYSDIHLIITNSYTFNKQNTQFVKLTQQFQKYFEKLKSEQITTTKVEINLDKKAQIKAPAILQKKQSQVKPIPQYAEKRQLALKLQYLPRGQLVRLIQRVNSQRTDQLNLQILPADKINYLQQYMQKRQDPKYAKQISKQPPKEKDESSFQSDSDS